MIYIYIALLFLENSSFSDNNSELSMLDLSSTSVSDSDTDHSITNYVSDVPTGEPRSKITGRFRQESIGNHWNVKAVFPPEIFGFFPMISDQFLPESTKN